MNYILECDLWCNGDGTDEADQLGTKPPPAVKRRGIIRLDRVIGFNEDLPGETTGVVVYFDSGDTARVAMPFVKFREAFLKFVRTQVMTGVN